MGRRWERGGKEGEEGVCEKGCLAMEGDNDKNKDCRIFSFGDRLRGKENPSKGSTKKKKREYAFIN